MGRRRERRRKQLLDNSKEKRKYRKLKQEALDRILWGTLFRRVYGPSFKMHYVMDEWCRRLHVAPCNLIPIHQSTPRHIVYHANLHIQDVTGGTDQTSGGCSLC